MIVKPLPDSWNVIAPGYIQQPWNEAEVMGAASWLWLHSGHHLFLPIHSLTTLLIPAIKHQQFILISDERQPIFYMSWAKFNLDAEARYINQPVLDRQLNDWHSGNRWWILDWIAPFGHSHQLRNWLQHTYFSHCCFRSLYHRGDEKGLKIKQFYGKALSAGQAKYWFDSHPVSLNLKQEAN